MSVKDKFAMLVLLLLLTAVLSCVGCIEYSSEKEEDTVMKCSKPFVNASISCSQNEDGEIICNVVYWIYDNYEIDKENATFNISGNTVQIHLPTVKYENYDDSCYRYFEATEINLGKKELFEEQGMYFVSLEGNPNQIGKFIFENGSLYNFAPARVEAIQIVQDGNMIKTVVKTLTGDEQVFTIDVENATYSDNFDENKTFTIQVSEKKLDYKELMTFIGVFSTQEFEIMPLDDLENGNYTIKINDQEATFVVRNHNIVRIYNFEK